MNSNSCHEYNRYEALLHEQLITPMHCHNEADDHLVAMIDGQPRAITPTEAGDLVANLAPRPELDEVEHVEGGPRRIKRRHILAGTAAGFGAILAGTALPRYAFAAPGDQPKDLLVAIFLRGGFDGLSAVVPTGDSEYYKARPTIGVKAEQCVPLTGNWGLNKNMAALKPIWDAGQLAIVQGAGTHDVSRSHFQDQATVERAAPANVRSGWLGRHLQTSSASTGTLRGITVGNSTVLSLTTTAFSTVAMSSIAGFNLDTWADSGTQTRVRGIMEQMYGRAGGQATAQADITFDSIDQLAGQRALTYTPAGGAAYPDTQFGRGLKEIAQLAKGSVGMEVACIDLGDWDMHKGLGSAAVEQDWFSRHSRHLAQALAAFRTDLGDLWNRTTVVTMSEFGRRVAQNGDLGTDHGQGNTMFIMGGGIKGGQVYGTIPSLAGTNLDQGDVPIATDYRQPLAEVVQKRLGNNAIAEVFPGFTPGAPLGIA